MEASQSLTFESAIKSIDCCSEISNLQIDSSDPSFVSYRHNNFKIIYKNKRMFEIIIFDLERSLLI